MFDIVSSRESERASMFYALAVSLAAYATFGVIASSLWPLIEPASAREVEVQLLPAPSAAPLGATDVELTAVPATPREARASLGPPRTSSHLEERPVATPVRAATNQPPPQLVAVPVAVPLTRDVPGDVLLASSAHLEADADTSPSAGSLTGLASGTALTPAGVSPPTQATLPFGPGMTPPRRLSGEAPKYTPQALAARIEGKVIVRCVLDTNGSARACRIVKPLAELDRAAVRALEASRFTPVTFRGRPTAVTYLFTFDFKLP